MTVKRFFPGAVPLLIVCALGFAGCTSSYDAAETRKSPKGLEKGNTYAQGWSFFGGEKASPNTGIGVNGYLWRASLDTLAFMPLLSADPFGGVIITDWHSEQSAPSERFKMTVYILDQELRADALRVAVFRQIRDSEGVWADAAVNADTGLKLENAILTRARQLRINTVEAQR